MSVPTVERPRPEVPVQAVPAAPWDSEGVASRHRPPGGTAYWVAVAVFAILGLAGIVALVVLARSETTTPVAWAYAAATLSFLLSTAQAAPVLAVATRLARGNWGVPLRRAAEAFAVGGLVVAPLAILLLSRLPDWRGRPSIWLDWPGAPFVPDSVAVVTLTLLGLALLYATSLPDLAAARDAGAGGPTRWLALGWRGTSRQWSVLPAGATLLGALYAIHYLMVHLLLASDLALSLVPGWSSAAFPAYHAVSGLQGGTAATVLALALLRRNGEARHQIATSAFSVCGRLLLALSLVSFWLLWSELLTYWYGRTPRERWLLDLLLFGPSLVPMLLAVGLSHALPFLLLIWGPIRRGVAGTVVVSALILVGILIDRVRVFGMAWSVAAPVPARDVPLAPLPPFPLPGLLDLLIVVGLPALVLLAYLLLPRVVPPLSGWEVRATQRLVVAREAHEAEVVVVARPS